VENNQFEVIEYTVFCGTYQVCFWPDSDLPACGLFRHSWRRSGHQSANASGRDL
jgi:hypothetical protein